MQILQNSYFTQGNQIIQIEQYGSEIMGETEKTSKAPKENWFAGLKAEFGKIIWPAKESLAKQTTAVVIVSVVVGLIIAVLDFFIQHGVDILVKL